MSCLSFGFLENVLIWLVVIGAIFAFIRLIVPQFIGGLGTVGNLIVSVLNIIVWAVVAIALIIVFFSLLSCVVGGGSYLAFPHH